MEITAGWVEAASGVASIIVVVGGAWLHNAFASRDSRLTGLAATCKNLYEKHDEDVAKLNVSLEGALKQKGMEFFATDPAAFRAALRKAGFYAAWEGKYGVEAWSALESVVGNLA